MNTNTVCIFPDTMPRAEVLFPLVQVFEPIVYLRSVENDDPVADDLSPLCREMAMQGLVRFDGPAPLGENRDRFLQLVHDLQHRRDDYAGQLSHLSLAGLGSSKTTESRTSIIGTLLKQTGIQDEQEEEQRAMILWQARLVLKLGEIFDREQEELQENLKRISAREKGLLEELRKEEEQPFSLTKAITAASGRTDGQLRLRLKAWSRIFGLGSQQISASVFITTSRDASDLLTEQYELEQKEQPRQMLTLLLPGGRAGDTFAEQRASFRKDAAELVDAIQRLLENPGSINEKDQADLDGANSNWAELLEQHYPAAESSRCTLTLYELPGIDTGKLFLETFGRDEDEMQTQPLSAWDTETIIGILEEKSD